MGLSIGFLSPLAGLEFDRGCRTKITGKVDDDVTTLWRNWSNGLHRHTVYGSVTKELGQFCRYMNIKMVDEAATRTQ